MKPVLDFELQAWRGHIIGWALGAVLFISLYLSIYPAFSQDVDTLKQAFESMPAAMQQMMGIGMMDQFTFLGFLGNVFPFISLVGGTMGALVGFAALTREQRSKTSEFLLTKPVSRSRIFVGKLLAGLLALLATAGLTFVISLVVARLVGAGDFDQIRFGMFWGSFLLIQLWLFAAGLFLSQTVRKIRSPVAPALTLSFAMFMLSILGTILGDATMRWLTPYRFVDYGKIVLDGQYDLAHVGFGLVTAAAMIFVSYLIYVRKDAPSL